MSLDRLDPACTPARPVLATVTIDGELRDAAAARLLRWCEARSLGRWRSFPTLDVARATLVPAGADSCPVDLDAIVLTTIHDRLR